jgi:hypothetical protein
MKYHVGHGDFAAARQAYGRCRDQLRADYDTPPTPALADRDPALRTMTSAGRCIVIAPTIGTQTIRAPTLGQC